MIYIYLSGRFFFVLFNDTPTTEIYTLSLHDALPIWPAVLPLGRRGSGNRRPPRRLGARGARRERARGVRAWQGRRGARSEEHTSELQSRQYLVCRLLLEKKKP